MSGTSERLFCRLLVCGFGEIMGHVSEVSATFFDVAICLLRPYGDVHTVRALTPYDGRKRNFSLLILNVLLCVSMQSLFFVSHLAPSKSWKKTLWRFTSYITLCMNTPAVRKRRCNGQNDGINTSQTRAPASQPQPCLSV